MGRGKTIQVGCEEIAGRRIVGFAESSSRRVQRSRYARSGSRSSAQRRAPTRVGSGIAERKTRSTGRKLAGETVEARTKSGSMQFSLGTIPSAATVVRRASNSTPITSSHFEISPNSDLISKTALPCASSAIGTSMLRKMKTRLIRWTPFGAIPSQARTEMCLKV